MDLSELIKELRPNIVTPYMEEILKANPAARGNVIARHIIRGMAKQKEKIDPIDILHENTVQTVRFLDVEPLCEGPWALYSLILLNISYGEQSVIIEALYPEKKQLVAKTFAALFSHDMPNTMKKQDNDILSALEDANAGIAMILAKMDQTDKGIHADKINSQRSAMRQLAQSMTQRDKFHKGYEKSQQKYKKGDKQ